MAVIESINKGRDGVLRFVKIRTTTTGRTNCPMTYLYLLEVTAEQTNTDVQSDLQPEQYLTDVPAQ